MSNEGRIFWTYDTTTRSVYVVTEPERVTARHGHLFLRDQPVYPTADEARRGLMQLIRWALEDNEQDLKRLSEQLAAGRKEGEDTPP